MEELREMLSNRLMDFCLVKDINSGTMKLQFRYPVDMSDGTSTYRMITVEEVEDDKIMPYFKGIPLSKEPIPQYKLFRLLEQLIIDYTKQGYDQKSNKFIMKTTINSKHSNKSDYTISINIGGFTYDY